MKNIYKRLSIALITILIFLLPVKSLAIEFEKPTQYKYVNDYVGIVDEASKDEIVKIGKELEDKTTAQATVVIIDSLQGYPIEDYANKLFRKWGIGTSDKDNGLLILMSMEDRMYRVEVGRGLEGAITDIYSSRVMEGEAKPYFQGGNYSLGLLSAYKVFAQDIAKEYGVELSFDYERQGDYSESSNEGIGIGGILIALVVIAILLDAFLNKGRVIGIVSSMFSGRRYYHYGSGPMVKKRDDDDDDDFWNPFGGGGSSGGGFGGFGGGGSNGGGSSGSW
ncbi:MAG: TPM domain-containing protein [Clostridium sp.]